MGPGLLAKAMLRGSFSLMVFGWTQVLMDLQPLIVMVTGSGELHGFTHTYLGAVLIGAAAAATGKPLFGWSLSVVAPVRRPPVRITWWVALLSGLFGSASHVALDSIMHSDVRPFAPASSSNALLGLLSPSALHDVLVYSGVIGMVLYLVSVVASRPNKRFHADGAPRALDSSRERSPASRR
jgi:hypothetical protein